MDWAYPCRFQGDRISAGEISTGLAEFEAGGARLGQAVGVSEKTARAAVDELIEKGHLTEERKGRTIGQRNSRERMVSLTRYDTETRKGAPDWPIEVWRRNMSNPA